MEWPTRRARKRQAERDESPEGLDDHPMAASSIATARRDTDGRRRKRSRLGAAATDTPGAAARPPATQAQAQAQPQDVDMDTGDVDVYTRASQKRTRRMTTSFVGHDGRDGRAAASSSARRRTRRRRTDSSGSPNGSAKRPARGRSQDQPIARRTRSNSRDRGSDAGGSASRPARAASPRKKARRTAASPASSKPKSPRPSKSPRNSAGRGAKSPAKRGRSPSKADRGSGRRPRTRSQSRDAAGESGRVGDVDMTADSGAAAGPEALPVGAAMPVSRLAASTARTKRSAARTVGVINRARVKVRCWCSVLSCSAVLTVFLRCVLCV